MKIKELILESKQLLSEAKGHMDHPEDMVIWGGIKDYTPLSRAVAALNSVATNPQAITIKIDGWPAIVFGSGEDGRFAIVDKHMFNSANKANRQIHSPQEFASREAAREEKARADLPTTVAQLWKSLEASYAGNKGWYMGDLIFYPSKPLNKIQKNGVNYYQFQANPEGLLYEVPVDSDWGEYIGNKVAGIAIHRVVPPDAANTEDRVTWLSGLGGLRRRGNVALLPVRMPVVPEVAVNKRLQASANQTLQYDDAIKQFINSAPESASNFANRFTVYVNSLINNRTLDLSKLDSNFDSAYKLRLDDELSKGKITEKKYNALINYYEQNRNVVSQIWKNWIAIYSYKLSLLPYLNKAATQSPIQGYLKPVEPNGKPIASQEGFVVGGIKLVDRLKFSAQNAQARLQKQKALQAQALKEDSNAKQTLVIYPGGFHPFHLGHASVFDHLAHKFSDGEVFVAATDAKTERPFGFEDKKFLAGQSGVPTDRFVQVKSPYKAEEITSKFDPNTTMLVFAVSEKDSDRFSFAPKKDGTPSYFQSYTESSDQPMSKHGYIYIVPKIDFEISGQVIDSASKIRTMYAAADDEERKGIIHDLYPLGKAPKKIKNILDNVLGGINEADNPDYFGGGSLSPLSAAPNDVSPKPSEKEIKQYRREMDDLRRFMGHGPSQ